VRGKWRVRIDPTKCSGRGLCAELLPEVIDLDDWGYPIISEDVVRGEVLRHARRAVAACPELALFLEPVRRSGRGAHQSPKVGSGAVRRRVRPPGLRLAGQVGGRTRQVDAINGAEFARAPGAVRSESQIRRGSGRTERSRSKRARTRG
jgi:ferredoxin